MTITINAAIKILKSEQEHGVIVNMDNWNAAIKLGIEALKRVKACRERTDIHPNEKLAGEAGSNPEQEV